MKGILIDPEKGTITEVEVEKGIDAIYKLIDCDCFDIQHINERAKQTNGIYVDDNGLCGQIKFGFQYGENQPIAGKGLILGCDRNGETVDTNLNLEEVKATVKIHTNYMSFRMS